MAKSGNTKPFNSDPPAGIPASAYPDDREQNASRQKVTGYKCPGKPWPSTRSTTKLVSKGK